jgi:hypothetical protein
MERTPKAKFWSRTKKILCSKSQRGASCFVGQSHFQCVDQGETQMIIWIRQVLFWFKQNRKQILRNNWLYEENSSTRCRCLTHLGRVQITLEFLDYQKNLLLEYETARIPENLELEKVVPVISEQLAEIRGDSILLKGQMVNWLQNLISEILLKMLLIIMMIDVWLFCFNAWLHVPRRMIDETSPKRLFRILIPSPKRVGLTLFFPSLNISANFFWIPNFSV